MTDASDNAGSPNGLAYDRFLVVALHARYNLIVLDHRKMVGAGDQSTAESLKSVEARYRNLQSEIEGLLGPTSILPRTLVERMMGELAGIRIALSCALLNCAFSQVVAASPLLRREERRARINAIVGHARSIREQLDKELRKSYAAENARDQETLRLFIVTALSNIEKQSLAMTM